MTPTGDPTLEAARDCHTTVRELEGGRVCSILIKDAFLNYAQSDEMKASLKDVCRTKIDAAVRCFVVDLSSVTVMDSCGLSILISIKKMLESEGARIGLASLSPMIRRLFAITKLDRVFEIYDDESAAAAAMAAPA